MNVTFGKKDHYYREKLESKSDNLLYIFTNKEIAGKISKVVISNGWVYSRLLDLNKLENFLIQNLYYKESDQWYDLMIEFKGL